MRLALRPRHAAVVAALVAAGAALGGRRCCQQSSAGAVAEACVTASFGTAPLQRPSKGAGPRLKCRSIDQLRSELHQLDPSLNVQLFAVDGGVVDRVLEVLAHPEEERSSGAFARLTAAS